MNNIMKDVMRQKTFKRVRSSVLGCALSACAVLSFAGAANAATAPAVRITAGPYHNGQRINISVGPNKFFTPYSRVNVLECADAGGKASNLPISVNSCDGDTIQGNSILVQSNGSFSERGYQLYAVPDPSFGEPSDSQPVCNAKKACVLYIGQNQESFTAPKIFSPPFTISKANRHK